MIDALLALLCLALVGLLVYRERAHGRDRASWHVLFDRLAQEHDAEAKEAAKERRELYQRIQAPELAVQEAVREKRGDRRRAKPIAADDDAAYAARREERV